MVAVLPKPNACIYSNAHGRSTHALAENTSISEVSCSDFSLSRSCFDVLVTGLLLKLFVLLHGPLLGYVRICELIAPLFPTQVPKPTSCDKLISFWSVFLFSALYSTPNSISFVCVCVFLFFLPFILLLVFREFFFHFIFVREDVLFCYAVGSLFVFVCCY